MAWEFVKVLSLDDRPLGYAIYCTVSGGILRPFEDSCTSVMRESTVRTVAKVLTQRYGDPRAGEHTIKLSDLPAKCDEDDNPDNDEWYDL